MDRYFAGALGGISGLIAGFSCCLAYLTSTLSGLEGGGDGIDGAATMIVASAGFWAIVGAIIGFRIAGKGK